MSNSRKEFFDLINDGVLIAYKWQMICARKLHHLRTRYSARDVPAFLNLQTLVIDPMKNERRNAYRWQNISDVDFGMHLCECECGARACAHSKIGGPPLSELRVIRQARSAHLDAYWTSPALADFFKEMLALGLSWSPGILFIPDPFCISPNHYECGHFFRVCSSVEARERTSFGLPAEHGVLRVHRVEHCSHVVHSLFESWKLSQRHAIREARATLVKKNEARK